MPKYFLESSAFIKRYKTETGSDVVNGLFGNTEDLFYLNLAIVEIRKVFFRLWRYPLQQDNQITEAEFMSLESRFAADISQMQRIEFSEEMIQRAISVLGSVWVRSVFDLAHLSAYLIVKEEFPDIIFVCSDNRSNLIDGVRHFVTEENVIVPGG